MNKRAFTLVELIVAITIIAILGTIAFISLVRSNGDARDSIRISDTKVLARGLSLKVNAEKVGNISEYLDIPLIINTFLTGSVYDGNILGDISYNVGSASPVHFGDNPYRDPISDNPYPIAIIRGDFGTYFQVAARLEDESAIVQGNYFTLTGSDLSGIIKAYDSDDAVVNGGTFVPY